MAESQEEKILKIFKSNNIKIKDVQKILPAKGKQPYYDRVRKEPLDQDFIELIKSKFNLDLVQSLKDYDAKPELDKDDNPLHKLSKDELIWEIIQLNRELQEVYKKGNFDKDLIIELQRKVDQLKDKYERKQG